jgi:hypothetical protein
MRLEDGSNDLPTEERMFYFVFRECWVSIALDYFRDGHPIADMEFYLDQEDLELFQTT